MQEMHKTWVNSWVGRIPWSRKWQPTAVLSPGESHGQRSLEGTVHRGHKGSDITKSTHTHTHIHTDYSDTSGEHVLSNLS